LGKTLIVTGSSRGIGAAIARMAGERGWDVAVNYRADRAAAEAVAAAIRAAGPRSLAIQGDIARESDVIRLFETVDRELGSLDALVNNAGIITAYGRVEDLSEESLRRCFDVNVIGCFLCAREAIRRLSTRHGGRGGSIVNISSRAATRGMPGEYVYYAASKGAIDTMTHGLALELAGDGIRVNAVSPGLIDTEIQMPDRLKRLVPTIPMGRSGRSEEVAEAVLWLLSDQASYVTGANILVSGGR
jgi:NAD(P)-dependent dehydrogenase (short-subunit alcohol dehydrogenase family)